MTLANTGAAAPAPILDPAHPWVVLASEIAWDSYADNPRLFQSAARVGAPLRLLLGLWWLRYFFGFEDVAVLEYFRSEPYWRHFCGGGASFDESRLTPASLSGWRAGLAAAERRRLAIDFAAWRRRSRELSDPIRILIWRTHYEASKKTFAAMPPPHFFPVAAFTRVARFDDSL